ncbi:MAG: CDP-alcohol phosphatidyltransferase family protein [Elusimicrobiota bacterium]
MKQEQEYKRVIDTFTGPWEKKFLPKMAAGLPGWVTPDILTALGLFSALVIAGGYILTFYSREWIFLSSAGLILHWFADSLDGTLARVRKIERENYGYFVDHISDVATVLLLCAGLGLSPLMNMRTALLLAIGYLLLNIYTHIDIHTEGVFRLSYGRLGPTEVRIVIIILNSIVYFWNPFILKIKGIMLTALDLGGAVIGAILYMIFIVVSIKTAIRLDRIDKTKKKKGDGSIFQ